MVKCVYCQIRACTDDIEKTPNFCPRRITAEAIDKAEEIRKTNSEVMRIAEVAKSVETEGYRKWPRVQELIEFSKRMGIEKIGVAFCVGLKE